jgi:4-aminobutyrate aminotransferase-like enzyme
MNTSITENCAETEENVGILESNSFNRKNIDKLDADLRQLVERRDALGPCYRLFYQEPLHLVRGCGTRLFDANGVEYLDMYNNIPSIGHSNPVITEAVTRQLQQINTHTRYVHENILDYADALLAKLPAEIDRVMFMCSGSEANDLAIRCAQLYTGGAGIIVTAEAYHGNTALVSGVSPSIGKDVAMSPTMRMIPSPDTYRLGTDEIGEWMCAQISEQIADMRRHGIQFAGVLFDSIFSSDGVIPGEAGFLKPVIDLVHKEEGLYIADEVQPGFCRTGEGFWGFERHGIVPDIVTMGKPMANGIACSAMAVKHDVLDAFAEHNPYFNTFAGNPVAMAAAQAVLNYLDGNNMLEHTRDMGEKLRNEVRKLMAAHPQIGDVRGAGLFTGIEIVQPGTTEPDRPLAVALIEKMRENNVLISLCGPYGNVLKVRPPLVFDATDLDIFISALDISLTAICE